MPNYPFPLLALTDNMPRTKRGGAEAHMTDTPHTNVLPDSLNNKNKKNNNNRNEGGRGEGGGRMPLYNS